MSEAQRYDLANRIRVRHLVSHHRGERQPSDEEDQNELKRSHLLTRTPPDNTHDENEEEVADECPHHGCHVNQSLTGSCADTQSHSIKFRKISQAKWLPRERSARKRPA